MLGTSHIPAGPGRILKCGSCCHREGITTSQGQRLVNRQANVERRDLGGGVPLSHGDRLGGFPIHIGGGTESRVD